MFKVSSKLLLGILMVCVLVQASFVFAAINPTVKNPLIVKLGDTESPTVKIGDKEVTGALWEGYYAFQSALEKYSQGRIKVELYANGRLGDNKSTIEQVLNGNLLVSSAPDGNLAVFYKPFQVFCAPYVFTDLNMFKKVMHSAFAKKLFDDMAAKTGLRILMVGNGGGYRCFANRKKEVKVPADMKGLKIRVMDSPIYQETVKACGAVPTPVAWMEVYSALQTGVVDGMEHNAALILSSSLYEVQKFYVLNKHNLGVSTIVTNEKFFKSLPADLRKAFLKAGEEAGNAMMSSKINALALEALKERGMKIYEPTPDEMKLWQKTREPALKWLRQTVGSKLVNGLLKACKRGK
jgi:tripartite ATP-independent transporter DctP family solute receptor